jgi:hypothetical protein
MWVMIISYSCPIGGKTIIMNITTEEIVMQVVVAIINGSGTHGKDEFIKMVIKQRQAKINIYNYSTIDRAKEVAVLLGCPMNDKTEAARNLWSGIKDLAIAYNNGPVKEAVKYVYGAGTFTLEDEKSIVFIHCREKEEIEKLKVALEKMVDQVITVLVIRPDQPIPKCEKDSTDKILETFYNFTVENRSLTALEDAARSFLDKYAKD